MPLTLKLFKSVFPPFTSCRWAAHFCGSSSKSIRYNKFALVLTVAVIFMASGKSMGQTWLPATGGTWTTGSNWSGGSAPVAGATVIINSDQSANITNVPAISLASLTVSGSCTLVAATAGNTITVTSAFSVSAGEVFTLGSGTGRFNFTLGASSVSTIAGTMTHPSTAPVRAFTNNGDLTITGLLNGGTTTFTTASGSTLRIGSLAGITNAGATGSVQMTGTRSYNTGANYHYIGSGAQAVGNGLPATVSSLTINNTGGTVTLASTIAITNALTVPSGTFAIGANNITTVGSVSMTGTSITGTGTVTLAGNVTTVVSATTATISALIATGAANRTFTIADGAANPDLVISSVISGTGGVIKAGAGMLTLSGANTFGTGLNHTAGTININHATAPGTGTFTIAGGTIDNTSGGAITLSNNNTQAWNGNFVFTGTQSLNLGTGAVTPNASRQVTVDGNTLTVGGVIGGGAVGITKLGNGIMTLSGANTFTGGMTLGAGTLNINNANALGASGTFTINGGTIDNTTGGAITTVNYSQAWNGNFVFTGTQSLNLGTGAVTPNASRQVTVGANTLTIGGAIGGGAVGITKLGVGTLTLSGASTFTGGMTLGAGTLNINNANALGGASGTFTINGGIIDNTTGGAITTVNYPQAWNGNFVFTGTQSLNLGTGAVTPNASRQVTVSANTLTIGGAIGGGAVGITKLGTGTLTLSGASTFTGGMTLGAGTLNINNANALGGASGTFTINGGIIDNTTGGAITTANYPQVWNSDLTFMGTQSLNLGTGTVTMNANRQIMVSANTLAVGGAITGAGFSLTKSGAGALTLSGTSTFSGGVNLNAGTLNINSASALGSVAGTFTINSGTINNTTGGTITTLNYPQAWNSDFVFTGTQNLNLGTGAITMGGNRQVTVNANTLTAGGVLSAAAFTLTKAGAGALNFGGNAVTLNSLTISAGTLTSTSGTLALAGNFTNSGTFIHNTGTVHYNGGSPQSVASVNYHNLTLSGAGQKNASGTINVANALTNTSVFDVSSNALSVTGTIVNTGGTIRFSGSTNGLAVNTGTIEYYGSSQTVTSGIYSTLLINQASGEASLGGDVTVNGSLTLSNGRLNTMASLLTLGSTASISIVGPSASKMIVASGGGEVRRIFASTGSFVFPIGENTGAIEYSPVTVNVTSAGGFPSHVTVSVTDAKHPNNSSATNFISRYWNVNTGLSPATATITGTYLPVDINGTEASASAAQLNGAFGPSNPWTKFTALGSNTLTATGATLTAGQTSAFTGISTSAPTVTITNGASENICAGSSVALVTSATGDPVLTYAWSPALGLSSTTISNPVAAPTTTTVYTVVMTDGNGITATDNITVNVLPLPTLTGASQPTPACESTGAVINLTGLLPSSTSTVNYSINGVAQTPVPGVVANGAGAGSFTTVALSISNNGQLLQVTGLTVTSALPNCSQVFSRNVTLTVQQTAVITTPPSAATGCEGSTVQYNVTAIGSNLAYQWQEDSGSGFGNITNGGIYSGATTSILTLTGITSAMNTYDYRVVVSNSSGPCVGNVTSAGFNLTVNEQPEVTLQPVNSLICESTNTTFTVSAGVTTVPGYQWQESTNGGVSYSNIINGGIYSGATTATLTLTTVPLGHSGRLYRAVITGTCSPSATSNGALLTVQQTAVITTPPSAATGCEGSTVQYNVTATGSNLAYQWQEDSGSGFTNVTNGGIYSGATTSILTLTGITSAMNTYDYRVVVSNSSGPCVGNVTSAGFNLTVNEQPEVTLQPVNSLICESTNTTFTVSAGVTTVPGYQWQESTNGGVSYSNLANAGIYSGVTTATLTLTGVPLGHSGRLYRAVITGTCSPSATSNGALLTVQQTAVITTPPSAATGCEGSVVQYNVTAIGSNLAYQWQEDSGSGFGNISNGGVYSGATSATLTLTGITSSMNTYDYRVVVSNSSGPCVGNVTSAGFNLTVNEQPEVTLQPVNSLICESTNTTFTVSAGVTTVPGYQWQESTNGGVSYSNLANAGIYSGVTTATLTLTTVPLGHSGRLYRAVITGTCSPSATSNGALLTVQQTAVITTPPSAATGCEGSTVQYNVTATGSNLAYQWQEDSGSGFGNITNGGVYSGATSATLTLTGITSSMNTYDYRVVVSNSSGPCVGNVTSAGFNLTVNEQPEVTLQPVNSLICESTNTTFTVNAGVTTVPGYQWQESTNGGVSYSNLANAGIYSGVTTATLTLTGVPLGHSGRLYRAVITGTCSPSATSNGALLTVQQTAVITTPPSAATGCEGSVVQYNVTAIGSNLAYQWQEDSGSGFTNVTNGGIYSGATTSILTLTGITSSMNTYDYRVVVSNSSGPCVGNVTSAGFNLTVNEQPEVTLQPVNSLICESTNTTFTVSAGVTTVPGYQWQESTNGGVSYSNLANAGIYSGVTTATLTLTGVPLGHSGRLYRAVITGTCSPSATSNGALLTVQQTAVITTPPSAATGCEGSTVQYNVTATGSNLAYQWQEDSGSGFGNITNGGVYSGATSATLSLTGITSAMNTYDYRVVVSNSSGPCVGNVTSAGFNLTVNEQPEVTLQPVNSLICESTNTTFTVSAGVTTVPGYQWQESTNGGVSYSNIINGGIYSGATTATLTLTTVPLGHSGRLYRAVITGTCSPSATSNGALLTVQQTAVITTPPSAATGCEGSTVQYNVTAVGSNLAYQWQEDSGSGFTNITNGGVYSGATSATLTLAGITSSMNTYDYRVVVSNSSGPCVGNVTSAGFNLTVNEQPEVTLQPVNSLICESTNTTFTVSAGVTTVPGYQWQESTNGGVSYSNIINGGIYSGATTATLTLTTVPLGHSGRLYRAVITGTCSPSATSNGALLTVQQTAVITTPPSAATGCEGSTVQYNVTAIGSNLAYQWQEDSGSGFTNVTNGGIYSGATTSILTLTGITSAMNTYDYRVVVSNSSGPCVGNVTSAGFNLTVNEQPEVTLQPVNSLICETTNTTFTVSAGVTTVPGYQWQESTNGGVSYSNLANAGIYSGVTTATLTLTGVPLGHSGRLYRAVITGTCSPSATSNGALLTVQQTAVITTPPSAATGCEGSTVQYSVTATGSNLAYQWQEDSGSGFGNITNGGIYSGATTSILTLTGIPSSMNTYDYRVVVSNSSGPCVGNVTSAGFNLTVNEQPEVTLQPVNSLICESTNTTFTVSAGVTTVPGYQWQESTNGGVSYSNLANAGIYSGVTTATLTLTGVPLGHSGRLYRAVITGTCSPSATSNGALLTVQQTAVITTPPSAATGCEGSTVQYNVTAAGSNLAYQWQEDSGSGFTNISNGGIYSGATTSILTLTGITSSMNTYDYRVVVSNSSGPCVGNVTSAGFNLTVNEQPEVTLQPVNSLICESTNTTFTVSAGVTTVPGYQWQESTNGGVSYSNLANAGIYSGVTTSTLTLTGVPLGHSGRLYRAVITGTCSPSATSNGALLTVQQTAVITTPPTAATGCEGSTVQYNVTAAGSNLAYQWQEDSGSGFTNVTNGGIYSGATTSILTLTGITSAMNTYDYRVVVSNSSGPCVGNVTSAGFNLTVNEQPEVTLQPVNSLICETTNTTFTVSAGVTTVPGYQWQESTNGGVSYSNIINGGIYSGATTATLTLTTVPLGHSGRLYRAVITGTCSPSATSNGALLTVQQTAVITTPPSAATGCEGSTVQYNVTAIGSNLAYQWQEDSGSGFGNISNGGIYSGATSATLTLTGITSSMNTYDYRVVVSNSSGPCVGNVTSAGFNLTVNEQPEVTLQPVNSLICESTNTTFTVSAGVTTVPGYQWQESTNGGVSYSNLANAGIYSGVTTATLTLTGVPLGHSGRLYRAVITGTCSPSATSNGALLTVQQTAVITTPPSAATGCEGSVVQYNVTAAGSNLAYQWQEDSGSGFGNITNGGIYSGATSATLTLTGITSSMNTYDYRVVVSNSSGPCVGNVTSAGFNLTVNRNPDAFAANQTICSGATTSISITNPNSVPSTTFSWIVQNSTNVSGASAGAGTTITQALTSVDGINNGTVTYLIQASALGCNGPAFAVTVTVLPPPAFTLTNALTSICSGSNTNITLNTGVTGGQIRLKSVTYGAVSGTLSAGALFNNGGVVNEILTNTTNAPVVVTYEFEAIVGTCISAASQTTTVTVNPNPTFTVTNGSTAICSGASTNLLFNSTTAGHLIRVVNVAYNGAGNSGTIIPGTTTFTNGNTLAEALTNTTNTPIDVVYEFNITTPSTTPVCPVSTASTFVTVRVNPTPDANGPNQSICSGTTSNVLLTNPNNVAGTTFSWTIGTVTGSVTGQIAGAGNAINQLLNSTAGGSVEYLITPSANGCPGTTISRIVTVNPIPVGTSVPAGTHVVCSGTLLGITPVSSVSGSTFVWNGSNGSGGTGNITDTPVNTGNAAIDITYTVIPTGPSTTFCIGASFTIVVTVNPAPIISNATPITICSGDALNFVPAINVAGSTYTWTSSIAGPVTPASVTASGTTPITDSPINVGSQAGTVTYTIIPTGPGSCVGASYNYTVTVRAEPVGANASASVCSDVPINYNLLLNVATLGNNVGSNFVWIATDNTNPGVTGESLTNQSGLIITDVITNTTNTDQVVTYTATPTGTNGCGGDPFIITITVKPEPVGVTTTAAAICSGTNFGYNLQTNVNTLGNNLAAAFTWIASPHPDITGESTTIKSGAVIDDVLVNTSSTDQTVDYTVTPTGQVGGCVGNSFIISVLVNPRPVFSAGPDLAVCVSDLSKVLSGSITFAPSGVSWSGGTGSFDVPSSATPTYTLSAAQRAVTSPLNVTLTLTANSFGACPVQTDQMILTVNPLPTVVIFGLPPSPPGVAENGAVIPISGNQAGGLFTITPGIGLSGTTTGPLDKATLDPDAATVYDGTPGTINHITYTYTDGNGCTNSSTQNLIVNAVTDVDFAIQGATIDSFGQFELCSELGPVKLLGFPAPNTGLPPETEFISLTPGLTITRTGSDYFIQTTGLPSGTYEIKYVYKNAALVVSDRIRSVKIFASPRAQFTSSNNCIINDVVFADLSTIDPTPFPTNIASWQWAFGDNDFSTNQNPSKRYLTSGTYNVTLRVTTLQGCSNATPVGANQVRVGDVPVVDFNWSAICNNDLTKFSDNTDPGSVSTIQTYTWDFGDGTPIITGNAGATIIGSPTTSGTYTNPDHEYPTFGNYNTVLTVQTNDGCSNGLVKRVFILPYNTVTPAASLAYEENFELTDGGWITEAFNATNSTPSNIIKSDTSWVWGTPFGVTINNTNSTKAWWTGDNTATFYSNENSVVNGPCFNLTQLSRPMVSLDYFSDVESVDGAVLQYSVNGGITWRIVGPPEGQPSRDEGINWFNGTGIFSNPGTQSIGNYGWTGKQGSWKNARFNLDMIPVANRAQVRLRIAFSSNDGNASVESFDGFAFDNFFVGEKKRNVLVEHFTTTSLNASISADTYLNGLYQQQITDRGASDFNNIQYHLNFAGTDQFNQGNPTDPAARALYFGASQPPYTIMDGILIPGKFTGVAGELNKVEIDRRALVDPQFTLTLDTIPTGNNKTISVRLGMTATKGINIPLIAQVALIEEDVTITSPSGTFRNVLRKLLMGSDGETINTAFVAGQTLNRERLNVELNIPIAASTKLTLVGFIQDKNSKEIYQSIVVKAPRKIGEIIVGVEDDEPVIAALNSIQMFPNPANNEFTFGLPGTIAPESQWKIVDQRGVIVLEGDFANAFNDQKQVDVSSLANGVYFVTITAPGGHVVRKKLVVMNRN